MPGKDLPLVGPPLGQGMTYPTYEKPTNDAAPGATGPRRVRKTSPSNEGMDVEVVSKATMVGKLDYRPLKQPFERTGIDYSPGQGPLRRED